MLTESMLSIDLQPMGRGLYHEVALQGFAKLCERLGIWWVDWILRSEAELATRCQSAISRSRFSIFEGSSTQSILETAESMIPYLPMKLCPVKEKRLLNQVCPQALVLQGSKGFPLYNDPWYCLQPLRRLFGRLLSNRLPLFDPVLLKRLFDQVLLWLLPQQQSHVLQLQSLKRNRSLLISHL
jgi:hypothetical protein